MDHTPFTDPRFLLTVGSVLIGVIFWFARLESKANNATVMIEKVEHRVEEIESEVALHSRNAEIHFNQRLAAEVDRGNERRFSAIEGQLSKIDQKIDRLISKV